MNDVVVLCDGEDDGEEDERVGVLVQGEEEEEEFSPGDKALPYEPDKTPTKKAPTSSNKSAGSASQTKSKFHIFDDDDDKRKSTPEPDFDKETFVDGKGGSNGSIKELKAKLFNLRRQKSALKLGFKICFPWFSYFHPQRFSMSNMFLCVCHIALYYVYHRLYNVFLPAPPNPYINPMFLPACLRIASQPSSIKQPKQAVELIEVPDTLGFGGDEVDTCPMNLEEFMDDFMNEEVVADVETEPLPNAVSGVKVCKNDFLGLLILR